MFTLFVLLGITSASNFLSIAKIDYIVEVTYEIHMYLMVLISIYIFYHAKFNMV